MIPKHWRQQLRAEFPGGSIPPLIHNQVAAEIRAARKFSRTVAGVYRVPARMVVPSQLASWSPTYRKIVTARRFTRAIAAIQDYGAAALNLGEAFNGLSNVLSNPLLEVGKRDRADV